MDVMQSTDADEYVHHQTELSDSAGRSSRGVIGYRIN
jgi:hypothetical protein